MNEAYKPFDVNVKGFADMTQEEIEAFYHAHLDYFIMCGGASLRTDLLTTIYYYTFPEKKKIRYSRKNIKRRK